MPKFRGLRSFVVLLSGADKEVLNLARRERVQYERIGWAILAVSCLASVSMWFLLSSELMINGILLVPAALFLGLVVMGVDRWLVATMPIGASGKLARAVPRLILSLLLGAVISAPLVLRVFQSAVDAQIATQQANYHSFVVEKQTRQVNKRIITYADELRQLNLIISSHGERVGDPSDDPQLATYEEELPALQSRLQAWTAQKAQDYAEYICDVEGGAQCPKKGTGARAQLAYQSYEQAAQEVDHYETLIGRTRRNIQLRYQQLTSQSEASQQSRSEDARNQLPIVQGEYETALNDMNELQEAAYERASSSHDILARLQALTELGRGNLAAGGASGVLVLLFVISECLPVTIRMLKGPGPYEVSLANAHAADQRGFSGSLAARPGVALSNTKAGKGHETGQPSVEQIWRPSIRRIESKAMSRLPPSGASRGQPGQFGTVGGGGADGGSGVRDDDYRGGEQKQRYLLGRYPERIPVGEEFGLFASVILAAAPGATALKHFAVPREGRNVRLEVHVPAGLRLLGGRLLTVRVPSDGDSEPVMFELRADAPGVRAVSVTAWIDGSYLGELRIDITAEHGSPAGRYRHAIAEIAAEPTEGAVSLVVRFDSRQNSYRFEFRDEDYPGEVTSNLAYEPGPRVEQLIGGLESVARGRSGHQAGYVRPYLVNSGAELWHELLPRDLREQFWERQHRIRQLTILADSDAVPWELLYPMDPGHDEGFLVEQFPVTRAIFGRRPSRKLSLWPARFVLPPDSLPEAQAEIDAMRTALDPGQPLEEIISGPAPLHSLLASGNFGLLHFACHNDFDLIGGSSIKFGSMPFTPTDLAAAAINSTLARSAPTVFINACRSAGLHATYNGLDSWATKFLEAGAAAFIGSLWAVSDGAAREFAQELYAQLQAGAPLGQAAMAARTAAADQPDDPTWLAYAVYGDSRATLGQERPRDPAMQIPGQ